MGAAVDETAAAAAVAVAADGGPAAPAAEADSKDLQQQSKALDKLTDHVEDRQLDSSRVQSVRPAPTPTSRSRERGFTDSVAYLVRIRCRFVIHWPVSEQSERRAGGSGRYCGSRGCTVNRSCELVLCHSL
jgi:hypothetical protein